MERIITPNEILEDGNSELSLRPQRINEYIGQDKVKERLNIFITAAKKRNEALDHVLLYGPPGLGKTTLASTFADAVGGVFNRIQMTPDLLPSDILGVNVYNPYDSTWVLRRGPIFGNIILIDEINRASPKVQSAFLQAMQEKEVTIENETLKITSPFMVVATQVPLGEQGTYPLTNVQIDRFAYKLELNNLMA